jgi:hypothetical protein
MKKQTTILKSVLMPKRLIVLMVFVALLLCNSNTWAYIANGTYSSNGGVLTISIVGATTVNVQTTGSGNYTFTLQSGGWSGTAVTGVSVSGTKLTVTSAATQNTINIVDGVAGVGVTFTNNTTSTYDDNFNVTLDNGAGVVTFNTASFSGSNALSVVTDRKIIVSGGYSLTTVDGDLTLSANMQATQNVANFSGIEIGSMYQGANTYVQSTGAGNVSITGRGGASSSNTNRGVSVIGTSTCPTTITSGGGSVTVTGTGGGTLTSNSNYGVNCNYAVISSGGNGNVSVSGTGGNTTGGNLGVCLVYSTISSGGDGSVTVTGTGSGGSGGGSDIYGVYISISHIASGGNGAVQVSGQGSTAASGSSNYGVFISGQTASDTSSITSGGGNITVNGTGGGSGASSDKNSGVSVGVPGSSNYGFIKSGGNGSVTVTGTGGNTQGANNNGIFVQSKSYIIASGTGAVSLTGNGGGTGTLGSNYGIYLNGAVRGNGITLNGYGATQCTGNYNLGVGVYGQVYSTGAGVVSVTGTGGGTDASIDNYGVVVQTAGSYISSASSNVIVTGIGGGTLGTGSSNTNYGVFVFSNGNITAGGLGTVSVIGTGGGKGIASTGNSGIYTNLNGSITSGGGDVTLEGHEGAGTAAIAINLASSVTTFTNGGILTLKGNSLKSTYSVQVPATTGILNVIPATAAVNIDMGLATDVSGGPIAISTSDIGTMSGGNLNFGDVNTGTITFSAGMTRGSSIKLTTAATGGVIPSFTGTDLALNGQILSFGSGTPLKIDIAGNIVNTDFSQLMVTGTVDLTGATLSLSGSYTPLNGEVFTIVSATSVTGTFTGLAEGAHVAFNGKSLIIHYTSTAVTLTAVPPVPVTSTFTGTGNWNQSARWNNGIPGAIDHAVITGNLTITGAVTVASLTVENGASILGNENLTVTDSTQAKRTITPNAWHLMSSSVNGAKSNSFYNNNLPPVYLQIFNNDGSWAGITDKDYNLVNGEGYSIWADNAIATATFNGSLNYGAITVPVLLNTGLYGGGGFNLLGNPYPSAIDLDVLYSTNTQSSSFYTWNQANGQYSTYNAQTQIGQLGATNIIPANQGFFVNVAAAGNYTFMDAYRTHSTTPLVKSTPANILRLNVHGNNLGDEAVITFNSNATNYYDFKFDSRKLMGSGDAPQLYTVVNGEKLSINSLSELIPNTSVSVPMNLEVGADGNYTITASELNSFTVNTTVYLIDSKTNQTINMSQNPVYNFTANTGDNANRFTVLFAAASGINSNNADNLVIFSHNNDVFVTNKGNETIREIQIMNALGQQVVKTGTESRISLNVETGYYFVKVITSGKTYTQKVFIH